MRELPAPPLTTDSLITAARSLGFRVKRHGTRRCDLASFTMPCVALLREKGSVTDTSSSESLGPASETCRALPALVVQAKDSHVMLFRAGTNQALSLTLDEFGAEFTGALFQFAPVADALKDPDGARDTQRAFGFRWFIPELLNSTLSRLNV
jgi:ABC-type bacteriocin/lantibiotic exporter with double-glycine peptidase domain